LCKSVFDQYKAKQQANSGQNATASVLEGVPPQFEQSLQIAQSQGAPALRAWLQQYGRYASDPRLAEIQLDYIVLISRSNPAEAKQLFQAVKNRTPKSSPVYDRIKRLEATYGK
jgi:hypothetical protein